MKTLFRYEAVGNFEDKKRSEQISHPDLVGSWFTDKLDALKTYIIQRGSGGKIFSVTIPEKDMEKYSVKNHPIAKNMDVDLDEFILPSELLKNTQGKILNVLPEGQKRFRVTDFEKLDSFLKENFAE